MVETEPNEDDTVDCIDVDKPKLFTLLLLDKSIMFKSDDDASIIFKLLANGDEAADEHDEIPVELLNIKGFFSYTFILLVFDTGRSIDEDGSVQEVCFVK